MEQVTELLKVLASKGVKLSAEAGRLNCYAQKGALTNEIRDGITRYKSEIIALLESGQKRRYAQNGEGSAGEPKEFPLSVGEKGLYIQQTLHPEMSAYNVPLCFRINSAFDTEILSKTWEYVLEQFPILTARVIEKDGGLYHRLDDGRRTTIQQRPIDFEDDQQLLSFLRKRVKEPFDLNRGPLTRIELFTQDKRKSILLLTIHHIVFDGVSAMTLLRSFLNFYQQLSQGEPVRLSHDLPGYHEFVAWEEAMLASEEGAAHAAYWRRQLAGELPIIEMPPDLPRSASQDFEGETLIEVLPEELSQWVRHFAKSHSFLPAAIFLGMFQLLLHRYTNQDDIIVGMPVMGRRAQKFTADVGFFINMVPIRIRCEEGLKLSEFLRRAQGVMLDALYHSSYPFPLMLEKLKTKQVRKNPVFQVTYAYQNFIAQADFASLQQQQTLNIEQVTEITQEEDSDFALEIYEKEALFSVHLKYNSELFSQQAIKRLFGHYRALLKEARESGDLLPHQYSIVTGHEKQQLLVEWNQTAVEFPRDRSIHALFEEQVERAPEAVAVVFQNQGLSYRELNARANQLARSLVERGVGPEVLVAVLAERGLDFLITMLAVFKAGGAYLPLDPHHPAPRIGQTLGLSRAAILVTVSQFGSLAEEAVADLSAEYHPAVLIFEELQKEDRQRENLGRPLLPEQLAYVIYTSGSTGVPKGAMVEHRGMLNHIFAKVRDLPLSEKDVVAQTASQCFDISVWQFLAALLVGGQVQIFDEEITHDSRSLLDQIKHRRVTILEIVPSMMRMMLAEAAHRTVKPDLSTLRWLIPTGEALAPELCREWFGLYPEIPLLNAYGPTECSDDVTHCPIEDALSEGAVRSPIGCPIANMQIYVLNPGLKPQPVGIVGELYVGGIGVGRGYLNDAEKTAESYVPDGFAMEAGGRLYKSGDLARYLPDGNLEYHGRIDHQVKIRGYRIELGEIEERLAEHAKVREAVVIAREDTAGDRRLVAYIVRRREGFEAGRRQEWEADGWSVERLRTELSGGAEELALTGVPNAKVARDVAALEWLELAANESLVSEAQAKLAEMENEGKGVDPEEMWAIGREFGYEVRVSWPRGGEPGSYEVLLRKAAEQRAEELSVEEKVGNGMTLSQHGRGWSRFANRPLAEWGKGGVAVELREYLQERLPGYMVPAVYIELEWLPLTPNGKIDRKALPAPDMSNVEKESGYVAPRTLIEQRLSEIWSEVLGLDRVGVNDDFFKLGGHSLLATQLVSKIRSRLDVDLPLSALFEASSVAQLAQLVAKAEKSEIPPIRPVDRSQFDWLPLSFAQERLWFIDQLEPESSGYNVSGAVTISGELDIDQLEQAFNLIIARHENLRTLFPSRDGQAHQLILDSLDFKLERIDLSHYKTRKERDDKAKQLCQSDAATPFDLARAPLIRGKVIKLAVDERVLMLNTHHIVSDGWSLGVLIKELGLIMEALRQGRQAVLAPLPIQYLDYGVWQRRWLEEGGELRRQLDYWQEKLAGLPESLDLPTDYPRPSVQSFAGASQEFALDVELSGRLKGLAEEHGCTLYMVLLAAFKVLLHRYTGQNDLCVGSPIANRQYGETEGLIGMFINTLALRTRAEGEDTFAGLLTMVKETCLEAYEHQDAPFEKVVDLLRPQRNLAISPLFQVMLILQNVDAVESDPRIRRYPLDTGISKFDLTVEFTETPDGLAGSIRYRTALYERRTIERMVRHLTALCQAITIKPAAKVSELNYIDEAERRRLLVDYNHSQADYPRDKCLHALFAEQVAINPDKLAVVFGEQKITYQGLYRKSCDLASYLRSQGVKPDSLVGLYTERSLDMVVGLLGILQAGGAYVPLDPDNPAERLRYMLEDAAPTISLTQERLKGRLPKTSAPVIALDSEWAVIERHARANPDVGSASATPDNLAYVIYTSGSTGKPKGVMVRHRGLVNYTLDICRRLGLTEGGEEHGLRFATVSTITADLGNTCIYPSLLSGGCLHVLSYETAINGVRFGEYLRREAIDVLKIVPSHLSALLSSQPNGVKMLPQKYLILGGEALSYELVERVRERGEGCEVINHYGPTETTIGSLTARAPDADMEEMRSMTAPIGKPIANTQSYILDRDLNPVPIGVRGELHIAGEGVARGYLGRPDLTAERFIPNPFSREVGERLYRTGDVVRYLSDGNIRFVGRADNQVKISGFRIELGEIEAKLLGHPEVREALVVAREEGEGDKRLVAYYTGEKVGAEALRAHLASALPDYMAPSAYVHLERLPLTLNGKPDRRALPKPEAQAYASKEYEAPQGEIEESLAAIWRQLLRVERVGRKDNFFELGGHSLLATQLISKIRSQMDVELPLKALFERGSVAQLAQLIAKAEKSEIPPIRPVDRAQFDRLPLSFAQERLWFINQLQPDSPGYNVPGAVVIQGELDIDQVEQAFNLVIARHENLRTVFPSQEGVAHQQILDHVEFKLERIDLSQYTDKNARDNEAKQLCRTDAATPFDLAGGPLIRGKVIKLAVDEHTLMLNMHHIISDGWSMGVLIKELGLIMEAFRQGRRPELAPLPIQYVDYSVWQRNWLEEGGVLARQLSYWQGKLAGVPESLDLATDSPRPNVQSFVGATQTFTLDAQLTAQLKRLADEHGVTLYMVLLAAFKVLLHRYTGQSDICVGSPIANRQYGETEGLIGMFVNTLALRTQVEGRDTIATLLAKVKTTCLEAYEHQDAPFEKVVYMLRLQRKLAISPLFQVMVILQNTDQNADGSAPDRHIQPYPLESSISKFDLTFEFKETSEGLAGVIEYSTALFKPQTIERMADHFIALCRAINSTPTARVCDLDYLGDAEKRRLLVDYNNTRAEYPKDKCIHHLFEEQVAASPDRTAVVFGEQELSYRELYDKSHDLALYLQSLGVGPDSIVGLCLERSLEMMVGILGTALAGGTYLPLDPDYPDERLAFMLEDSGSSVLLTQRKWEEKIGALSGRETRLVALDARWPEVSERAAALKREKTPLRREVGPHNLCYIIYTSGSTGRPKGVAVTHRNVARLVKNTNYFRVAPDEVFLQFAPISFDASTFEIWGCLLNGARLTVFPTPTPSLEELGRVIEQYQVTILWLTAGLFQLMAEDHLESLRGLRQLLAGGDVLSAIHVEKVVSELKGCQLINGYGPTESTTFACCYPATPSQNEVSRSVPIGRPIANTSVYVLDRWLQPSPVGVTGELYIGDDGLARGYLKRPELTAERFIPHLFSKEPGARLYRTGDQARWMEDGNIQYLGRIDTQVKIRGFRIELGEIEARLNQHPQVQDCAVVARGEGSEKRLIAFYRAKESAADRLVQFANEELRSHLLKTLPDYMAPAVFVSLAAIPLNPNGKVDRRALQRMDVTIASGEAYVGPRNGAEQRLVAIWAEVLNLAPESIGVNDNFFELGGHSLSAAQLMAKTNRYFEQMLPLAVLFTAPNIAAFAKLISNKDAPSFDILVPIQTDGDAPPVFAVPGAGGNVLSLQPLSKVLGAKQPFFALQGVGLDGKMPPLGSVEQTAQANLAALKTVRPRGPYSLIGHSYGGVVAYEMARILLEQGEGISYLILLDSIAPSIMQRNFAHDEVTELVEACIAVADLYGARLEIDVERLRQLSNEEKGYYLAGLLDDRGLEINREQFTAFYRVYRANLLCYRAYKPSLLSREIDVSLYRATQGRPDRLNLPRDYGWDQLLQRPIRIYDVEANHFSILEKVRLQEVTGAFKP